MHEKTDLWSRVRKVERKWRRSFGESIDTPADRARAKLHFQFFDHAFLRAAYANFDEVAPGVYRSNQPSPSRLRRYARRGIKSILNLRGVSGYSPYLFEKETCDALGLSLHSHKLWASKLPRREDLTAIEEIFARIERPFVMHCKSGSDRAGLGAALYLMMVEGRPVDEARAQLSWRYIHFRHTSTGILDFMLDCYAADHARVPMPIGRWIREVYDREALTAAFKAGKAARARRIGNG